LDEIGGVVDLVPKLAQLVEHGVSVGVGQADSDRVVDDGFVGAGEVAESSAS